MANSAYLNGTVGLHPFASGQSLNLNFDDPHLVELAFQQHIGQQHLSPTMPRRHDSMFQCSPTGTSRPSSSQHQAESQPYANIHGIQHSPNGYSHLPVNMSRSTSQVSHTSSGQHQQSGNLHRTSRASFGSNPPTSALDMSRSYSNASAGQHAAPQSYATQPRPNTAQYHVRRPPDLTTTSAQNLGYGQTATNTMETFDFAPNAIIGGSLGENEFGQMDNTNENTSFLSPFSPTSRPPFGSFGQFATHGQQTCPSSSFNINTTVPSNAASLSPGASSAPRTPSRRRRRPSPSRSPSASADPIIGQVTLAGKFTCLDPACANDDLTFGRQADFKRHYENVHAGRSVEYFCPEAGCLRSRNASGGKKGRSFKGRKDKMREHLRTVHGKEGNDVKRKRKRVCETDDEDADESLDGGVADLRIKIKRRG